ncbi:MAG: zf-HC2 domain-containing protein [bacterium]|nr:zf-HC2 domain-containing protein [bacterium]
MSNNSQNTQQNPPQQLCDLLAAYEMNLLERDERSGFEAHLPDCPDCLEEMYSMAPATAAMNAEPGVFADQAQRYLERDKSLSLWERLAGILSGGPSRVLVPVIAAAVLAVVIFLPQGQEKQFSQLAISSAPAYSTLQVRAGNQDSWLAPWENGMEFYQDKNYSSAAEDLLQAVTILAADNAADDERYVVLDNARLYLGVSQMLAGQVDQCIGSLQNAANSSLPPVSQKCQWYLAQAYLLNEMPDEAVGILQALIDSPVFGSDSRQLMEQIEDLLGK